MTRRTELGGMRSRRRRAWRRFAVTAAAASVAVVIAAVPNVLPSSAAWNDDEWVSATDHVGVVDCDAAQGVFTTRGEGRLVSGSLLGFDLDEVAEASGMLVENDGAKAVPDPSSGTPLPPDAFANPLNVTALSAVNVDLGRGILQLPLNNNTGLVNQYGLAAGDGRSVGASGLVSNSGAVALEPADGYPELGSLGLSSLVASLNPTVAATLAGVTDVSLDIGAVAGRATVDGCDEAFGVAGAVTRDYLAAGLGTTVSSPTIGALVDAVRDTAAALQTAVNGVASDVGLLSSIENGVGALLNNLLGGQALLRLANVDAAVTATIDLSALDALLTHPFGDKSGIVSISPLDGTVSVDTAALLGAAHPGTYANGLNGLQPNTELLVNGDVTNALTDALGAALDDWLALVQSRLLDALSAVAIDASVVVKLQVYVCLLPNPLGGCLALPVWVEIGELDAAVKGPLSAVAEGSIAATAKLVLLPGLGPIVGALLNGVLAPVLSSLVSGLVSGLGRVVGSAVDGVIAPLATLGTAVTGLTGPIVSAVSGVFTALYANGVVSLTVNAQNDPASGGPQPADWAALDAGQYDVAALRVGILDALGANNVHLYLGRGSVGANTAVGAPPDPRP